MNQTLHENFVKLTSAYGGKSGMCVAAAVLAFLALDPVEQAVHIRRVFEMDLDEEIEDAVAQAKKTQLEQIKARETRRNSKKN